MVNNSWHFTYFSTGTVGSGFLQAKRRLTYYVHPANQGGVSPPPPIPPEASTFDLPKQDLDIYYSPIDMSEVDIKDNPRVGGDPALNLKADEYTMGLRWYANSTLAQLDAVRAANGGLLSYGVQVQIDDYDEDTPQASFYNIIGISFRLDDSNNATMTDDPDNMYGISFVKLTKPTLANGLKLAQAPAWYQSYIDNTTWDLFSTGANAGRWFVVLWKRIFTGTSPTFTPLAYQKLINDPILGDLDSVCRAGTTTDCTKIEYWSTLMVYVEEITGANKITGYLASPPLYERSTTDNPTTILWAEKDKAPDTDNVPIPFQPINWTTVTGSGATTSSVTLSNGTSVVTVQDSSLTTLNYNDYTIGDITQTKAREIGLHIFDMSTSAQNIFYDNLFIDLAPSGYGYMDGSGQVVQYP